MNARSILHVGINEVAVRDVDVRDPGPGEVLIETVYSGISPGTELRCLRGKRPGGPEWLAKAAARPAPRLEVPNRPPEDPYLSEKLPI